MSWLARNRRTRCAVSLLAVLASAVAGCSDSGSLPSDSRYTNQVRGAQAADAGRVSETSSALTCKPVDAPESEKLPARGTVLRRITTAKQTVIPTGDLFEQFRSHCGGCHVDAGQGMFQVNRQNFADSVKQTALDRIRSPDRAQAMPPPGSTGKLFSERAPGEALVEFATMLEAWLQQGRPAGGFTASRKPESGASPYQLSTEAAMGMTNLGSCIPEKTGFGQEKTRSAQLDAKFEAMSVLPERLKDTDLFSLDSEVLAQHGVVAFAPGYPLWSDNAKKIRMIRVPRGKRIQFDKATQTFSFPTNTRFYKTFLKEVIDRDGNHRYRKVETRLIVSRPDNEDADVSPTERHTALFGSYAWNDDETEAVLVQDPLRNGRPFRDRVFTIVQDEQKAEAYARQGITDLSKAQILEDRDAGAADAGLNGPAPLPQALTRTYAIPGSDRCIHCHMGSPAKNFSLGFLPVQLKRRPKGEGGVIDETGADELTQLQRFLDYGLIEGMTSADEVLPLEQSQGDRPPRNDYELDAQGYMLGNCAHCHNPRGFPTSAAPELTELLNFMPDGDKGGIFQFPLDRVSPRILRGPEQNVQIPYITPSLFDLKPNYGLNFANPKIQICKVNPPPPPPGAPLPPPDAVFYANEPVLAPWRSLIYRNIDTPFSYSDDSTIFPHMPRDTAGYDCRVRRLLGSWMASIPARLAPDLEAEKLVSGLLPKKNIDPTKEVAEAPKDSPLYFGAASYPEAFSTLPQPYEEVLPDDPDFASAERFGLLRAIDFGRSPRISVCPDPALDIVDPSVVTGSRLSPGNEKPGPASKTCDVFGNVVPERTHWFVTDLTEASGDWNPRRADWEAKLRKQQVEEFSMVARGQDQGAENKRNDSDRRTLYLLTGKDPYGRRPPRADVRLTQPLREFALSDAPLGIWKNQSCVPPGAKHVSEYSVTEHPWLRGAASDAPVYTMTPGAQVFTGICANCHGPLADSNGRMADTIADLTGGATRVANLRDGVLGPLAAPGENRQRVFGPGAQEDGLTVDDLAGRYLLWMGLGGTLRFIPPSVLTIVANSRVLGVRRTGFAGINWEDVGANMLAVAEELCKAALPATSKTIKPIIEVATNRPAAAAPLLDSNGDSEVWQRLCTFDNPAPIRALEYVDADSPTRFQLIFSPQVTLNYDGQVVDQTVTRSLLSNLSDQHLVLIDRTVYPNDTRVGDQLGGIQASLNSANLAPWCILPHLRDQEQRNMSDEAFAPIAAASNERARKYFRAQRDAAGLPVVEMPMCPPAVVDAAQKLKVIALDVDGKGQAARMDLRELSDWARRGAMNAGLAVFVYLDALSKGQITRAPDYNTCPRTP